MAGETVAILLGAHEWPRTRWVPHGAFLRSVEGFKAYILDPQGLDIASDDVLDLFDSEEAASKIDEIVDEFLSARLIGNSTKNLLIYYVGHGAFTEGDEKYCLAVRSTRLGAFGVSAYRFQSLARTINRYASDGLRKFVLIDACYSGAAAGDLAAQSDVASRVETETIELLAASGTALLCAASAADVALYDDDYTMFTGSLLATLKEGSHRAQDKLSFDEVRSLLRARILEKYKDRAVQPELHIPDQRRGDISKIAFFPNPVRSPTLVANRLQALEIAMSSRVFPKLSELAKEQTALRNESVNRAGIEQVEALGKEIEQLREQLKTNPASAGYAASTGGIYVEDLIQLMPMRFGIVFSRVVSAKRRSKRFVIYTSVAFLLAASFLILSTLRLSDGNTLSAVIENSAVPLAFATFIITILALIGLRTMSEDGEVVALSSKQSVMPSNGDAERRRWDRDPLFIKYIALDYRNVFHRVLVETTDYYFSLILLLLSTTIWLVIFARVSPIWRMLTG